MFTRWKLMAGVLGVSIGGLAAAASQCPKWDRSKGRSPEEPVAKADMKVAPAGAPAPEPIADANYKRIIDSVGAPSSAPPAPELPPIPAGASASGPTAPAAPQLVPAGPTPAGPVVPPVAATKPPSPPTPSTLPAVPDFPSDPVVPDTKPPKPDLAPASGTAPADKPDPKPTDAGKPATPPIPPAAGVQPIPPPPVTDNEKPPLHTPISGTQPNNPGTPVMPPPDGRDLVGKPNLKPVASPPSSPPNVGSTFPPPTGGNETPLGPPALSPDKPPAPPVTTLLPPPVPVAETKFRILLRVGDGEPTFEVKNGDNLVLKVACDKVDIKSPEKGGGPSEVTARGKVRFAGFGAEGTCDELKFFAGTGEVSMTGAVKVQVKDKLGRVESELTTGSMKYKIDSSAVGGQLKP